MTTQNPKTNWLTYCENELETAKPILESLGFILEATQPHIAGERYLMRAVTTVHGQKLILLGRRQSDNKRVIIKITSDEAGKKEIQHERTCRKVLHKLNFGYGVFFSPQEILFTKKRGFIISIQEFLEQECTFLERPIEEQFTLALSSFKAQESVHATTYKHRRLVEKTFGNREAETYLDLYQGFQTKITKHWPRDLKLQDTIKKGAQLLATNTETIEQYGSFLTHVDFVPHNFRIVDGKIFLLDYSSLHFGNKYEGWARFLNFMTLYNPALEQALKQYVKDNRTEEELLSLKLMRVYRLGEIIWYYTDKLQYSEGNLLKLNTARVHFWADVLNTIINDIELPSSVIADYKTTRDSLRSEDEKERQKGLH